MMITHLGNVTVYVKDQQKALEFYRDVMGFEVHMDQPMGARRDDGLRWRRRERRRIWCRSRRRGWRSVSERSRGWCLCAAISRERAKDLAGKGVEFKHGPEKQVWGGIMAQFYDVDKNGFVLVQMP